MDSIMCPFVCDACDIEFAKMIKDKKLKFTTGSASISLISMNKYSFKKIGIFESSKRRARLYLLKFEPKNFVNIQLNFE